MPVVEKLKGGYKLWIPIRRNMPRTEQFGIGTKIDSLFMDTLEILRMAGFSSHEDKVGLLVKAMLKTDSLRFFIQLAWETKLISKEQFATVCETIEETGRMIGGWKKGLIAKTPAKAGEK